MTRVSPAFDPAAGTYAMPSLADPSWGTAAGDGVREWDVTLGSGDPCPAGATALYQFTGWLAATGTLFDTTYRRGPAERPLAALLPGLRDHIPGMKAGGVRNLDLPPAAAFGSGGAAPAVPANARLVCQVELVSFR